MSNQQLYLAIDMHDVRHGDAVPTIYTNGETIYVATRVGAGQSAQDILGHDTECQIIGTFAENEALIAKGVVAIDPAERRNIVLDDLYKKAQYTCNPN